MYRLQYLPLSQKDIHEMLLYIAVELKNPDAALSLMDKLEQTILLLREFPYAHPLYRAPMRLPSEIRFVPVENYLVFYTVLEPEHIVEIRRVLYDRVDLRKQPL